MIALVKTNPGPGNVKLIEVNEPTPGLGQVKIAVEYCGICGTDLKIKKDLAPSNPPVILGHEFCGIVYEIGEGVKNFKKGDRVVSETMAYYCGSCKYCQTGNYFMCDHRLSAGYGVDGGFAKFCVIREGALHKLPDNVSFEQAALAEPLAVCVHLVIERSEIRSGEFAREWILENAAGRPVFKALERIGAEHPIESVGERLRSMMTWISSPLDEK